MVGFSDIVKPLTQTTEEKLTHQWSPEAEVAVQSLKWFLYDTHSRIHTSGYFIVDNDASNVGIGRVKSTGWP